jgi:hypothetical protein
MQRQLVGAVLLGSAAAAAASEVILFWMFSPPDASAALLAGAWVAMPYLAAALLAALFRRTTAVLTVLLVSLIAAGSVGGYMLAASGVQLAEAERQARDAVLPGEDPTRGPAAMRKSGADAGVTLSGALSAVVVLVVPPAQSLAVVFPTLIGFGVAARARRRTAEPELA